MDILDQIIQDLVESELTPHDLRVALDIIEVRRGESE